MSSRVRPWVYADIDLTVDEANFPLEIAIKDKNVGGNLDLTPYTELKLFEKTTDYLTDIVSGGIVLTKKAPFERGIVIWDVLLAHVPNNAGQFYGKIDITDGSEIIKTNQFDIRVKRSLTS